MRVTTDFSLVVAEPPEWVPGICPGVRLAVRFEGPVGFFGGAVAVVEVAVPVADPPEVPGSGGGVGVAVGGTMVLVVAPGDVPSWCVWDGITGVLGYGLG